MARVFVDNALGTLAAPITSGATSITLDTGHGARFPSLVEPDYSILTLTQAGPGDNESSWEEVKLTSRTGDVLTVVRAQEGSTAAAWAAGDKCEIRITAGMLNDAGTKKIPQNIQPNDYEFVLADRACHVLHPSADTTAREYVIPANADVPFEIGDVLTTVNQHGAGVITLSIVDDTMRLAGSGDASARTISANGIVTALKITETEWLVSGVGVT